MLIIMPNYVVFNSCVDKDKLTFTNTTLIAMKLWKLPCLKKCPLHMKLWLLYDNVTNDFVSQNKYQMLKVMPIR